MKNKKKLALVISVLLILAMSFALVACGSDEAKDADVADSNDDAEKADDSALQTLTTGKLTIATGEPAWEPWVLNDDPASGEGFEAAVAYAVAEELGFAKEDVVWVRTTFDEAIQPGPKQFDFNLQQYDITAERAGIVDFSSSYYQAPLVVITKKDSKFAGATTFADFNDAIFGAPAQDVAGPFINEQIKPAKETQIYNNLSDVFTALNTGQIDATVVGLLTGDYVINIEGEQVEDGVIVGSLAGSETFTDGLGLLLAKDSPLTDAVTAAVDKLRDDGTLAKLQSEWLSDYDIAEIK
jgi:polar amino acid transport system substrate-binding protein